MNKIVHLATMSALALGAAALVGGCKVTVESATIYNGTPVSKSLTYVSGYDIVVEGDNGEIKLERGNGSSVEVTFEPFSMRADDEGDLAQQDMEQDLELVASADGQIVIKASKKSGATGGLGAHITVTLPAGFDAGVDVWSGNGGISAALDGGMPTSTKIHTDNGSLDITGADGVLNITQDNGVDCDVRITGWTTSDGVVSCDSIDSNIRIAKGLSGNITVVANNGVITDPSPLPSDWIASEANVDNSKAFSFGADAANMGIVDITNDGDIILSVN